MVFFEYKQFTYFNVIKEEKVTEKFIFVKKGLSKNEIVNLPITKVYYDCDNNLKPEFKNSKITHLVITNKFTKKLDNLPNNLKYLYIKGEFYPKNEYIVDKLPNSLELLHCDHSCNRIISVLPPKLKYLRINELNNFIDNLPSSLIYLKTNFDFNKQIDFLPASLKYLYFGHNFNQPINNLPSGILELKLNKLFEQPLSNFPSNLKKLILRKTINHPVILPSSLEYLDIKYCSIDKDIDIVLPSSLKLLNKIGCYYKFNIHEGLDVIH